jgi:hypothetical protein
MLATHPVVSMARRTVKAPIMNKPDSMILFFFGKRTLKSTGIGMLMMIRSEDTLKTVLVMRWCVAAEHCAKEINSALSFNSRHLLEYAGTAQY